MTTWPLATQVPFPDLDGTEPCHDGDPERFFPPKGSPALSKEAREDCKGCRVLEQCQAYGLANDVEGIWGGMPKQQRDRWRRKNRIRAHPVIPFNIDGDAIVRMAARGTSMEDIARVLEMDPEQVTRVLRRELLKKAS